MLVLHGGCGGLFLTLCVQPPLRPGLEWAASLPLLPQQLVGEKSDPLMCGVKMGTLATLPVAEVTGCRPEVLIACNLSF